MRKKIIVLILTFIFSFLSCIRDKSVTPIQPNTNSESKIKRKLFYNSLKDKNHIGIYEYQYDKDMKLEKILHYWKYPDKPYGYELFEYNIDNEIVNRLAYSYANDSIGWVLNDSTYYSYENGKLIHEETYFFPSKYHLYYYYEYENSNLIKKYRYDNQQLLHYTVYDYSKDICVKETWFTDSGSLIHYIIHHYEKVFLLKSEYYSSNDQQFRIINYTYDNAGNLIIEESKKIIYTYTAPMDYVIRYEYY